MYTHRIEDYRQSDVDQLPNIGPFSRLGYRVVQYLDDNPTAEQPKWVRLQRESNPIPSMVHTTPHGRKPRMRKGGRPNYVEVKTFSEMSTREREGIRLMGVFYMSPTPEDRIAAETDVSFNPAEYENRPLQHVSVLHRYLQEHPDCTL